MFLISPDFLFSLISESTKKGEQDHVYYEYADLPGTEKISLEET